MSITPRKFDMARAFKLREERLASLDQQIKDTPVKVDPIMEIIEKGVQPFSMTLASDPRFVDPRNFYNLVKNDEDIDLRYVSFTPSRVSQSKDYKAKLAIDKFFISIPKRYGRRHDFPPIHSREKQNSLPKYMVRSEHVDIIDWGDHDDKLRDFKWKIYSSYHNIHQFLIGEPIDTATHNDFKPPVSTSFWHLYPISDSQRVYVYSKYIRMYNWLRYLTSTPLATFFYFIGEYLEIPTEIKYWSAPPGSASDRNAGLLVDGHIGYVYNNAIFQIPFEVFDLLLPYYSDLNDIASLACECYHSFGKWPIYFDKSIQNAINEQLKKVKPPVKEEPVRVAIQKPVEDSDSSSVEEGGVDLVFEDILRGHYTMEDFVKFTFEQRTMATAATMCLAMQRNWIPILPLMEDYLSHKSPEERLNPVVQEKARAEYNLALRRYNIYIVCHTEFLAILYALEHPYEDAQAHIIQLDGGDADLDGAFSMFDDE